jgi:cyclopropane-fatty-acyl-phospholipid synthase
VDLHDERLVRRLVTTGAIGLAEGWIAGEFDSPDLATVIELGALHLEPEDRPRLPTVLDRAVRGAWNAIGRASAPRGPLRTTVEHYDLGNAFFRAWLDRSMTYSSAVFGREDMSLEEAQREKYRRISAAAGLREGLHVLEIGSGWGGFASYAAGEVGCRVTTVTDSREQAGWVEKLVAEEGLGDRVEVRREDFSWTPGTYDAVVSIEMIESIPRTRWPELFRVFADRDFVRRYVFPGGQVPSPGVLRADAAGAGLRIVARAGYGASYARTLGEWRRRFDAAWPTIADLGFDERFGRMWQYYLSYCEGGFRSGRTDVSQIVLEAA